GLLAQMVHDASVIRIQNPYTRASLRAYTEDCVVPMLYTGALTTNEVLSSTDLWQTLKIPVPPGRARLTTYYSDDYPTGDIQTCISAWTGLKEDFAEQAPGLVGAAFSGFQM